MSKPTPGPWFVSGKQKVRQDRRADMPIGSCQPIAVTHWRDGPENARLIAAAPELYAALELMLANEGLHSAGCKEYAPGFDDSSCCPVHVARAALAKARGDTP